MRNLYIRGCVVKYCQMCLSAFVYYVCVYDVYAEKKYKNWKKITLSCFCCCSHIHLSLWGYLSYIYTKRIVILPTEYTKCHTYVHAHTYTETHTIYPENMYSTCVPHSSCYCCKFLDRLFISWNIFFKISRIFTF